MRRCVEETVEVAGVVADLDVAPCSRLPLDHRQQSAGVAFENGTILIDSVENCRRHREMYAGRIESASREHVVHEVAMNPSVAVFKRVDIDKPKGKDSRCHHGVEFAFCAMVEGDQSPDEG